MLNREEIKNLIGKQKLVQNYLDLDIQLTPNGFDLTIEKIFGFDSKGALDFSNSERVIPAGKEVHSKKQKPQDKYGWWNLKRGVYKIRTNERVNLPKNLIGISFTRSSLLRMGAFTQTGVWDACFEGKAEFILAVENSKGGTSWTIAGATGEGNTTPRSYTKQRTIYISGAMNIVK